MNISAFIVTSAHSYPSFEKYTLPAFNVTESGSNKYFYIGMYLGLAAANSVSHGCPTFATPLPLLLAS